MADIEHGFRPTNPDEEPQKGSEDKIQDTPDMQGTDHYQLPDSIQLPSDETLTPHKALDIQPHEQAHAEGLVTARRAEASSGSFLDRLKRSTLAKIGTVALAMGVGAGVTAKVLSNDNESAPTPQVTTSAPAVTSPSNEVSPTPKEVTPSVTEAPAPRYTAEDPAKIAMIDGLVTVGQTSAESEAGVKKFELLTEKERTSWDLAILDRVTHGDNPQVVMTTPELTLYTYEGKNLADYSPIKNEVDGSGGAQYTRQSSPKDVFGLWLLQKNITSAYSLLDSDSRPTEYNKYYSSMLVSGEVIAADPQTSAEYRNVVDSAMDSDRLSVMKQHILDSYTVVQGSELHPLTIGKETYEAMTIEYRIQQEDGTVDVWQVVRAFEPMPAELGKDANGLDLGLWKTVTNKQIKTFPAPAK